MKLDLSSDTANHAVMKHDLDFSGHYQRILRTLLASASSAVSREELVNNLFTALKSACVAQYFILVEGSHTAGGCGLDGVRISQVAGLGDGNAGRDREHRLKKGFEARWRDSAMLRRVLLEGGQIDFLNTDWVVQEDYDGEFRELHGDAPVWLCAVPLPSSRLSLPLRAVFALYEVHGHAKERDSLPPGAQQEWSLIQALPIVYAMLDHQLSSVAGQVARQRREIITELAPRAINHEIGTAIKIMQDAMGRMGEPLRALHEKLGDDEDFRKLLEELHFVREMADHAEHVTEAFTNIEKRNPEDIASLRELIEEAVTILSPLLNRNRIKVVTSSSRDIMVRTDAALVQHVVLNVMSNAIEAIEDEQAGIPPREREERHIYIELRRTIGQRAEITISNDGPEIAPGYGGRIFERGVTTRPHGKGHGQGLFICRLIASYLEGEFGLCPSGYRKPGNSRVCFRLAFPLRQTYSEDLQASQEYGDGG